ncbi:MULTISPECIES: hypothetical protein [unclassified Microcoleus]|uniref:hypothetical protein n=2 Tax=unclassified Microcoleus TaxID=2642155 RepID=UPI002FD4D039
MQSQKPVLAGGQPLGLALATIYQGDLFSMLQEKRLKPWTIVRSLPNVEKVVVGEFRSWSDADGHLKILKRMVPADRLTVVFDPVVQA